MAAISGAAAKLLVNGVVVGRATGVSASETITQVPVQVLGEIDVVEYEPVSRDVTFTADVVRISLDAVNKSSGSLQSQGAWPRGGTVEVINFPEMTALILDITKDPEQVIYKIEGVSPETRTWRVDQGSIMTVNASFRARRMYDEVDA